MQMSLLSKKIKTMENTINIGVNAYGQWFMETLNYCEREKIRVHYRLKAPTLKITDGMLREIYHLEISKPEGERLLPKRFYKL